jgi:hypothetical protein
MKSLESHYLSSTFNKGKRPEEIFDRLPRVSSSNKWCSGNVSVKNFKINNSSDKFWHKRRQSDCLTIENSQNVTLPAFTGQFGELENEEEIIEDLKNIDRWVFENLQKIRFFCQEPATIRNTTFVHKMMKSENERNFPNIDLKLLDLILKDEKVKAFKPKNCKSSSNDQMDEGSSLLMQRVIMTSEMVNLEHNKKILIELVKRKLRSYDRFNNKPESYLIMMARMILVDIKSSFKVLKVFKAQSIFHLNSLLVEAKKEFDESISNAMKVPTPQEGIQKEVNLQAFEKALLENFMIFSKSIKITKQRLNLIREKVNKKKNKIKQLNLQRLKIANEIVSRENPQDFKTQNLSYFNPQEFIYIADLKKQLEEFDTRNLIYSEKANKLIGIYQEDSRALEIKIADSKFKKTLFFAKLKELYYSLLLDEQSLLEQNKTVISVVKHLWAIKADIKADHFSKFYPTEHIQLIFSYTKLHNEFMELKRQSNVQKKAIKEQLINVYHKIVDEKENVRITEVKKTIAGFKNANAKVLRRNKPKKEASDIVEWENAKVTSEEQGLNAGVLRKSTSGTKNPARNSDLDNIKLANVSETLCHLKENIINSAIQRVSVNGKTVFTGMNSVWLKKLFALFFGKKEAQFLINELMKANNIKKKEVSI